MKPILYSFRRCPYAIRARLALTYAGIETEHREIELKHKPLAMLQASAKGTVPILVLANEVIDESLEIMQWAIKQSDKQAWLAPRPAETYKLITENDEVFKQWLDKYKYADRYPEKNSAYYREQGELFLRQLEYKLQQHTFLFSNKPGLADFAIFPFIRQFAFVDITWFNSAPYPKLQAWLDYHLKSTLFTAVMKKELAWKPTL